MWELALEYEEGVRATRIARVGSKVGGEGEEEEEQEGMRM